MAGQDAPATIDQAVSDVLVELERASAAEQYRTACIERMRATIQLAALTARGQILSLITTEAAAMLLGTPDAGQALGDGLLAADVEATRLLAALGIDLAAAGEGG